MKTMLLTAVLALFAHSALAQGLTPLKIVFVATAASSTVTNVGLQVHENQSTSAALYGGIALQTLNGYVWHVIEKDHPRWAAVAFVALIAENAYLTNSQLHGWLHTEPGR